MSLFYKIVLVAACNAILRLFAEFYSVSSLLVAVVPIKKGKLLCAAYCNVDCR